MWVEHSVSNGYKTNINVTKSFQVPIEECDYLIDLDFLLHPISSELEPRYATMDETWERVACQLLLDARHSFILTRIFWLPGERWRNGNEFGDYCLLRNWKKMEMKETKARRYLTWIRKKRNLLDSMANFLYLQILCFSSNHHNGWFRVYGNVTAITFFLFTVHFFSCKLYQQ